MRSDDPQIIREHAEPPLYLLRALVRLPVLMSKAGEGDSARRVADCFKNIGRLEFVKAVNDFTDRIIIGEDNRSGSCADDQNTDGEQQKPSHHDFLRDGKRRANQCDCVVKKLIPTTF